MSKNTRNRILLTALAAMLLVVVAVGGTMAWLVDSTKTVTNTFTTSNVDIDLDETVPNNKTEQMVPGDTIAKDPKVTVIAGSEASWVFVKVVKSGNYDTYLEDYDVATGWTRYNKPAKVEGECYGPEEIFYRTVDAVSANTDFYVLAGTTYENGEVKVKPSVTNQLMDNAKNNNPTLTFTAYACQQANVSTVEAAWEQASGAEKYGTGADAE